MNVRKTAGAAMTALALVMVTASAGNAMEGPEPDPTPAPVYRVTLNASTVHVTVPGYGVVNLNARTLPLGRSVVRLTGKGRPLAITVEARRPSRFGPGMWASLGEGDIYVLAPLEMYSPAVGRWLPQRQAPVWVQERTKRGWRTRATLVTIDGEVVGVVHLGVGLHVVRVARPEGATVTATVGRTRVVEATGGPFDI